MADRTPSTSSGSDELAGRRGPRLHLRVSFGNLGSFGGRLALLVVAAGLAVIGVGWNGIAGSGGQVNHISSPAAQLPYLLSGGFLGLAIVVLGAALLVSQSNRADRGRLEAKLDELVDVLSRDGGGAGAASADTVVRGALVPLDVSGLVAAGAASYHRPDCRLVDGRPGTEYLTPAEASSRGLAACRVCQPDRASSTVKTVR